MPSKFAGSGNEKRRSETPIFSLLRGWVLVREVQMGTITMQLTSSFIVGMCRIFFEFEHAEKKVASLVLNLSTPHPTPIVPMDTPILRASTRLGGRCVDDRLIFQGWRGCIVQSRKLAKVLYGCAIVGFRCFCLGRKSSEVHQYIIHSDVSTPHTLKPRNAFIDRSAGSFLLVPCVLLVRCKSKVFPPVIKAITVDVINYFTKLRSENNSVHSFGVSSVVRAYVNISDDVARRYIVPEMLGQRDEICIINEGDLTSKKCNPFHTATSCCCTSMACRSARMARRTVMGMPWLRIRRASHMLMSSQSWKANERNAGGTTGDVVLAGMVTLLRCETRQSAVLVAACQHFAPLGLPSNDDHKNRALSAKTVRDQGNKDPNGLREKAGRQFRSHPDCSTGAGVCQQRITRREVR